MNPSYSQIILIACFWPLIALGVTFLRFGQLPGDSKQIAAAMLGFLLVGLLSGFVLIFLLRQTVSHRGSVFIIVGYILAAPFGYGFGIVGPLALETFGVAQQHVAIDYFLLFPLAISLYGSLPPICGAVVGLLAGRISDRSC
jgi:hypothetical protein